LLTPRDRNALLFRLSFVGALLVHACLLVAFDGVQGGADLGPHLRLAQLMADAPALRSVYPPAYHVWVALIAPWFGTAAATRLFAFAAFADKYEGAVHRPPFRGLALAINEPVGVIGIVAPEAPALLPFVTLMAGAIAAGNTVVMVPSEAGALAATDLYQVLDTSDLPAGVVNIVTGEKAKLGLELAKHDAVDAIWAFGGPDMATAFEKASTGNLKQTWCETITRDWSDEAVSGGREVLWHATQVKNIWVPWGE